jgi:predicted nucleotidyltransferase
METAASALLGSRTLPEVLALLTAADRPLTASEIARRLSRNRESVQRAVARLHEGGFVEISATRKEKLFRIDRGHPEYLELLRLGHRLAGIGTALREAAQALGPNSIEQAFIFGSVAAGRDVETSDIDVFAIGEARLHRVAPFLRNVDQALQRDIHLVCRRREYVERHLAEGWDFYVRVWRGPKLMLIGNEADLPALPTAAAVA